MRVNVNLREDTLANNFGRANTYDLSPQSAHTREDTYARSWTSLAWSTCGCRTTMSRVQRFATGLTTAVSRSAWLQCGECETS
jgi:hypothetical protein